MTYGLEEVACLYDAYGGEMHFLGARAQATVQGQMLHMRMTQHFRNPGESAAEITYICPLPWGAVLLGVDVVLNGQALHGRVVTQQQARTTYEDALAEGHSSVLVACNPDGSVSMELGNLLAGETCQITLQYAQVLQVQQGSIRWMLPTAMAPRYGDAVHDGGFAAHNAPLHSLQAEYPLGLELRVHGPLAHAQIDSPTHALAAHWQADCKVLTLQGPAWLDRDVVVQWQHLPASSVAICSADAVAKGEWVTVAHWSVDLPETAPAPVQAQILIDCSGSMQGATMHSARGAVQGILGQLQAHDSFSLSRFGSRVEHCHSRLVQASAEAIAHAHDWAERLQADMGGTEMAVALESTMALQGVRQRADILLVTDGAIHAIDSLLESLRGYGSKGCRVFVVGVGASVSERNLQRLAQATSGAFEHVAPGEAVQAALWRMFQRLRSPRLTHVRVQLPPGVDAQPVVGLPQSCFVGDQLTAYIRHQGAWPEGVPVRITAHQDGGRVPVVLGQCVPQAVSDPSNTPARMQAHARFERLVQFGHSGHTLDALALRYQLVTPRTHFVLVHEREAQAQSPDMPVLLRTPSMVPAGMLAASSLHGTYSLQSAPMRAMASAPVTEEVRRRRLRAARKVDALLEGGPDDLEIPDFLRPQREAPRALLTPLDVAQALETKKRGRRRLPSSCEALKRMKVPDAVVAWLRSLVAAGEPEYELVQAWVDVLWESALQGWPQGPEWEQWVVALWPALQPMAQLQPGVWPACMAGQHEAHGALNAP